MQVYLVILPYASHPSIYSLAEVLYAAHLLPESSWFYVPPDSRLHSLQCKSVKSSPIMETSTEHKDCKALGPG